MPALSAGVSPPLPDTTATATCRRRAARGLAQLAVSLALRPCPRRERPLSTRGRAPGRAQIWQPARMPETTLLQNSQLSSCEDAA